MAEVNRGPEDAWNISWDAELAMTDRFLRTPVLTLRSLANQPVLEKIVNERTAKIQIQNEILIKYSYTNAHHLRGPVARLLGLGSIYKLENQPNADFIIDKMVDQANEIDAVIKQINIDLESRNIEFL